MTSHSWSSGFIQSPFPKVGILPWPAQPRWHQISCKWAIPAAILIWARSCPSEGFTKSTWYTVHEIQWTSFWPPKLYILTWNKSKTKEKNLQCYHPCRKDLERYGSFVQIISSWRMAWEFKSLRDIARMNFTFQGRHQTQTFLWQTYQHILLDPFEYIFCFLDMKSWSNTTSSHFLIKFPVGKAEKGISVSVSEVGASTKPC